MIVDEDWLRYFPVKLITIEGNKVDKVKREIPQTITHVIR